MKRILLSIIALMTIFNSVAYSFDFHRLDNVNIEEVKIKAQQGDAEAQCTLGYCFLEGQYVEENVQKALEWLHKSAKQECSDAQTMLGIIYYSDTFKFIQFLHFPNPILFIYMSNVENLESRAFEYAI